MTSLLRLTALVALVVIVGLAAQTASGQVSHTFTFDSGATDEGWASPFAGTDDKTFSIVNIGGSNRIQIPNTDSFQDAGRGEGILVGGTGSTFFQSMAAASVHRVRLRRCLSSIQWCRQRPVGALPAPYLPCRRCCEVRVRRCGGDDARRQP
jgi:hypothetical protein